MRRKKGDIVEQQTSFFRAADRLNIHTVSWLPEGEPRAVVFIVHGLGEHSGRYAHVAPRLVEAGYAVYALDHRGHGRSEGERAYFDSFDQPIDDLKQYFDEVKALHPDHKCFVYGHSLGSLISLSFALRYQKQLAGIVISGTPLAVESAQPALLIRLAGLLNNFIPKAAITAPLPSTTLSRDPAVSAAYDNDPLVYHDRLRVRMGYQIIAASRGIRARAADLKLPIFIFHGSEDKLCPPAGSQILFDTVGSTDKTLRMHPGLRHETHNEPEKEMVISMIVGWLNAH